MLKMQSINYWILKKNNNFISNTYTKSIYLGHNKYIWLSEEIYIHIYLLNTLLNNNSAY